jgi:lipopolysaccharide export system protein LptA
MDAVTIPLRAILGVGAVLIALSSPHGVGAQSGEATAQGTPSAKVSKPRDAGLFGNFSLTSDRGPVHIRADELEFDYRASVLTYRGAVTVKQGDLTLTSNLLRVTLDPKATDQLREVVAEGAVQITKGERRASGGRAVFDQTARTIVLSDQATLRDGPNEVAGERVVVYLDDERSVIEGGKQRVQAILFPPDKDHETSDDGSRGAGEPMKDDAQQEIIAEDSATRGQRNGN